SLLFWEGCRAVKQRASIHTEKGFFFDREGIQRKANIVHIGEIAALAQSRHQHVVLYRNKNLFYRQLPPQKPPIKTSNMKHILTQLQHPKRPQVLYIPMFLLDPLQTKIELPKASSWTQPLEAGGPIAWVLCGVALLGLLLLCERLLLLLRVRIVASPAERNHQFTRWLELQQTSTTLNVRKMGILAPIFLHLTQKPRAQTALSAERFEEHTHEQLLKQTPKLERSFAILGVLVTVSPLLGLLGTVTGMITTFMAITTHGTGNAQLLSKGIAEALITTELGLMVAIPLMLGRSFLKRWSDRTLEQTQLQLIHWHRMVREFLQRNTPDTTTQTSPVPSTQETSQNAPAPQQAPSDD
ncbi:MAG: MotA/TolQ/ExbB proton channel family protein, partial [Myxococcota bacterium]